MRITFNDRLQPSAARPSILERLIFLHLACDDAVAAGAAELAYADDATDAG